MMIAVVAVENVMRGDCERVDMVAFSDGLKARVAVTSPGSVWLPQSEWLQTYPYVGGLPTAEHEQAYLEYVCANA